MGHGGLERLATLKMDEIDYRGLLKRYLNHIGEQEGVYYLHRDGLSKEDVTELHALVDEIHAEMGIDPR